MADLPAGADAAIGRTQASDDLVTAPAVAAMAAALGRRDIDLREGAPVPPLWHGLFRVARLPPDRIGADGLPLDSSILPDIDGFPRRLFGGARYRFDTPLRIGRSVAKHSEVIALDKKAGRSGEMIVARVRHRFFQEDVLATDEENDILYLPAPAPDTAADATAPSSAPAQRPSTAESADVTRDYIPDPVMLFRHSAALFNSHRIHYDRDYTRAQGLPGLLVQGTLIARLMLEMLRQAYPDRQAAAFRFRAGAPVYDTGPFRLVATRADGGDGVVLTATGAEGQRAMTASADLVPAD